MELFLGLNRFRQIEWFIERPKWFIEHYDPCPRGAFFVTPPDCRGRLPYGLVPSWAFLENPGDVVRVRLDCLVSVLERMSRNEDPSDS